MAKKNKNEVKFNVLEYDFTKKKIKYYDIIPYFKETWKDKKFNFDKKSVKDKESLKSWIERASHYRYWARCEYEFLIASWPFGSHKITEDMKSFLKKDVNLDDCKQNIDFYNIILQDMEKIDIHEQIMMNIDVLTDILYKEFKLNN